VHRLHQRPHGLVAVAGKERPERALVGRVALQLRALGVPREDPGRIPNGAQDSGDHEVPEELRHARGSRPSPTTRSSTGRFRSWLNSFRRSWPSRAMRERSAWIRTTWTRFARRAATMPATKA